MKIKALVLTVIFAVLFIVLFSRGRGSIINTIGLAAGKSSMRNIKIVQMEDNVIKWSADIKNATLMEDKNNILVEDIAFAQYEKNIKLNAKKASYDINNNVLTSTEDFKGYKDNYELIANNISYDFKTERLISNNDIKINAKNITVSADKIETQNDEQIKLTGKVKVVFKE
ncbi:secreted protein containing DUF1239 [Candidatus Magnetoovum chiemensis]|nr:secreted protein containing DUF1239 [Candidatus Magnetoovum chiemensis]